MNLDQEAIELARGPRGKITVEANFPIETRHDLSVAYTPGVGAVSKHIAEHPESGTELTWKKNTVAVITDGSAVLGLGNLGAVAALPVMEGKALLFKRFGHINAVPICLDTQDTDEIIRTVQLIAPTFGGINLEDIAAPRCFAIEQALRKTLPIPIMHDDQWGTATVVLAGLINAFKVRDTDLHTARIVIVGSGSAGISIARILVAENITNLTLVDTKGVVRIGRENLNDEKVEIATASTENLANDATLEDAMRGRDVVIGVAHAGILGKDHVASMAAKPIVFALSNPVPEIMPVDAKEAGALIVASGRSDFPNQINNVLAFPGLFRGALRTRTQFEMKHFIKAAYAIASCVPNPTAEQIIPDPFDPNVHDRVSEVFEN